MRIGAMKESVEISNNGDVLCVCTPGQYAMDLAIEILSFLDDEPGIEVKNTGWKNGFGLEVAIWHRIISSQDFTAEITTDGEGLRIRVASGSELEFGALSNSVIEFLEETRAVPIQNR
jgi:hypothetical protein